MEEITLRANKNRAFTWFFALLIIANSQAASSQAAKSKQKSPTQFVDWYPQSIALPNGVAYHCDLTPLPRSLPGIPESDRRYINHTYSMILRCAQAKTIMISKMQPGSARTAYSRYYADTSQALDKIRREPTPKGLERFRNQVMNAIILQVKFFDKASKATEAGTSLNAVLQYPEGKQASALLVSAFGEMAQRYPSWGGDTKDSIYHHLCALDLF